MPINPASQNSRELFLRIIRRYIPFEVQSYVFDLPIPISDKNVTHSVVSIPVPEWAQDIVPDGCEGFIVPQHCIAGFRNTWKDVDWLRAIFDMATCQYERQQELETGPIHSYSFKLPVEMKDMFTHAWVNRIALFLRRWAARVAEEDEMLLFGSIPKGKVYLTHDVDYVNKTTALRLKQTAFNLFNMLRSLIRFDLKAGWGACKKTTTFLLGPADYWQFDNITELEAKYGVRSYWNFYGGYQSVKRGISKIMMDPAYDVSSSRLKEKIQKLKKDGHIIGLHQSFFSWENHEPMECERTYVEQALDLNQVETCRQHWLRFSYSNTWKSQEKAGIKLDMTLGFNDITGFRNGAAIRIPAWNDEVNEFSTKLETLPMVLMDSHLFDYQQSTQEYRRKLIDKVLAEVGETGGEVSVIWHQRVFHKDYGWGDEYEYLLQRIKLLGLT